MNSLEKRKEEKKFEVSNDVSKKREVIWDTVKGIGIISIVLGHVTPNVTVHHFVYMYHLVIFFFVAAYFFNEKKYGDQPFAHIGQRIKGTWMKYVFYCVLLIVLHNVFVEYHFYAPSIARWDEVEPIVMQILNTITFQGRELFASALWFVPTLLIALGLFGGIIYIARKFQNFLCSKLKIKNEKIYKIFNSISVSNSIWNIRCLFK